MSQRTFRVDGQEFPAPSLAPGLHVVATPIGNLGDITLRALQTLASADMVAAEDTRHTGRLLSHFGIKTALIRYDEHGAAAQRPKILSALSDGCAVALVSDAGTPLISDPGYRLIGEARAAGATVHAVPGPSAVVAALSVAGMPTDAFFFGGFLPAKAAARQSRIAELSAVPGTLAFYEAPHRVAAALGDLEKVLGQRYGAVVRELTKRFETVDAAPLAELAARYANGAAKGEIVILVAPPGAPSTDDGSVRALLADALKRMPASAAAAEVAKQTGRPRRALYQLALSMKPGP